jgi:hypothetical protein
VENPADSEQDGQVQCCQVHDIVLDVINQLSAEEGFVTVLLSEDDQQASTLSSAMQKRKIRRLSINNNSIESYAASPTASRQQLSKVRSLEYLISLARSRRYRPCRAFVSCVCLLRCLFYVTGKRSSTIGSVMVASEHLRFHDRMSRPSLGDIRNTQPSSPIDFTAASTRSGWHRYRQIPSPHKSPACIYEVSLKFALPRL